MLTQKLVRKLFNYNKETGILIRRNIDMNEVGCKQPNGYLVTYIKPNLYYNHQIIWVYMYDILTTLENGLQIDHRNQIKTDNRLVNLRLTNNCGNSRNSNLRSNNTSNIIGVSYNKNWKKWVANININYKQIKLGGYTKFIDAVKARYNAELKYSWPMANSTSKKYLIKKGKI